MLLVLHHRARCVPGAARCGGACGQHVAGGAGRAEGCRRPRRRARDALSYLRPTGIPRSEPGLFEAFFGPLRQCLKYGGVNSYHLPVGSIDIKRK